MDMLVAGSAGMLLLGGVVVLKIVRVVYFGEDL
jgi:hypothetical protein